MQQKKTLVLGATPNPHRYAFFATEKLKEKGYEVLPVGIRKGHIGDSIIINEFKEESDVHTITLYLSPERQKPYYDYIFQQNPARIIFNPGTENAELESLAKQKGIECLNACTLVMLNIGNY